MRLGTNPSMTTSEYFDEDSNYLNSNSFVSSRQFAPNKLPLNRLVRRIHFKANYIK